MPAVHCLAHALPRRSLRLGFVDIFGRHGITLARRGSSLPPAVPWLATVHAFGVPWCPWPWLLVATRRALAWLGIASFWDFGLFF